MQAFNFYFSQSDAQLIKGIPLCQNPNLDTLVWHFAESRVFTIASAYQVVVDAQDLVLGMQAPSASSFALGVEWTTSWNLLILLESRPAYRGGAQTLFSLGLSYSEGMSLLVLGVLFVQFVHPQVICVLEYDADIYFLNVSIKF